MEFTPEIIPAVFKSDFTSGKQLKRPKAFRSPPSVALSPRLYNISIFNRQDHQQASRLLRHQASDFGFRRGSVGRIRHFTGEGSPRAK